jgi:3'-5' exoribonuclease
MRREFAAAESAGKRADEPTEWVRSMERPLFNSQRWLGEEEASAKRVSGDSES